MSELRIGWRRLYKTVGISSVGVPELDITRVTADGLSIRSHFGTNPAFRRGSLELPEFAFAGEALGFSHADLGPGTYLEIMVSWGVAISARDLRGLAGQGAAAVSARKAYLERAKPREAECSRITDFVAGAIGLNLARQAVIKPVSMDSYIEGGGGDMVESGSNQTLVLAKYDFDDAMAERVREATRLAARTAKAEVDKISVPLHWLLKAWRERDEIAQFVYMFIPLEAVLPRPEVNPEIAWQMETLRRVVSEMPEGAERDRLTPFLGIIESKLSPSLIDRFTAAARQHSPETLEIDVAAFKKFNKMRNELVHRGNKAVQSGVSVKDETRTLRQLAEKYIRLVQLPTLSPRFDEA